MQYLQTSATTPYLNLIPGSVGSIVEELTNAATATVIQFGVYALRGTVDELKKIYVPFIINKNLP